MDFCRFDFCRFISRFLAVFLIAGLISQPLATPAAAKRLSVVEMSDMAAMSGDMAAMSGDMACCLDGQKSNSCQDCPLVAMCTLMIALVEPTSADSIQVSFQISRLSFALVDMIADGLIGAPPDHPPRTLT